MFTVMRFEETVVQVYSPVLLGSFSFEAEKSELESSSSELLCFDVCHHFGKFELILFVNHWPRVSMGLTDRRKTAKTLVDSRKK